VPRIKKAGTDKKKRFLGSQAATDRVQKLRGEYWEKVKNLEPENGVYILLLSRQNSGHPDLISVIWVKNQSP
jgi:hypothetical protein